MINGVSKMTASKHSAAVDLLKVSFDDVFVSFRGFPVITMTLNPFILAAS